MNPKEELMQMANRPASQGNWFSPTAGTWKVTILDEPKDEDVMEKQFGDRRVTQIRFRINVATEGGTEEYLWDVTKGKTIESLWGQLNVFAQYCNSGKYSGKEFTLIVKGEGMNKDYTIYETVRYQETAKNDFKMPEEETVGSE